MGQSLAKNYLHIVFSTKNRQPLIYPPFEDQLHQYLVMDYIKNQHEHHKKKTFKEEYRSFLKKYQIEYDERYVWD